MDWPPYRFQPHEMALRLIHPGDVDPSHSFPKIPIQQRKVLKPPVVQPQKVAPNHLGVPLTRQNAPRLAGPRFALATVRCTSAAHTEIPPWPSSPFALCLQRARDSPSARRRAAARGRWAHAGPRPSVGRRPRPLSRDSGRWPELPS